MTPHIISYLEFIGIGFDQYVVNDGGKNTKEEPTNVEEPAKEKVKNTSKKNVLHQNNDEGGLQSSISKRKGEKFKY